MVGFRKWALILPPLFRNRAAKKARKANYTQQNGLYHPD